MNKSKILPAIVLGAASLVLSTSVMAEGLLTGIADGTGAVLTGVGHATTTVVGGVVHGTKYVVDGVANTTKSMWDGHGKVQNSKQMHDENHNS